jgi:hypothetical protein
MTVVLIVDIHEVKVFTKLHFLIVNKALGTCIN